MDLYAYAQIPDLAHIAEKHGIDIPRLRGYRLMSEEDPFEQVEIDKLKRSAVVEVAEDLCRAKPFWSRNPEYREISRDTDRLRERYLVVEKDEAGFTDCVDVRWDALTDDMRETLLAAVEEKQQAIQKQFDTFNKYVGKNVLYIHSRMGGGNWEHYEHKEDITSKPWFLERVDDCVDGTYCDFYASLEGVKNAKSDLGVG